MRIWPNVTGRAEPSLCVSFLERPEGFGRSRCVRQPVAAGGRSGLSSSRSVTRFLADHLLAAAQRENWTPDGAINWVQAAYHDQSEQLEIGAAAQEAERIIWARKSVREKLLKQEPEKKSSPKK